MRKREKEKTPAGPRALREQRGKGQTGDKSVERRKKGKQAADATGLKKTWERRGGEAKR